MNRPMPTEMAVFSCVGTALNTAVRNPVSTSTRMISPSRTTSPIASAQAICGTIVYATNALRPRPAASASGKLATRPIRMLSTPATSAVAAATLTNAVSGSSPMTLPSMSRPPVRMIGLSTMM
jgi:hypothetical protein